MTYGYCLILFRDVINHFNNIKMDQASHIWKMLDDMAASDPEAYKKFVE